MADEAKEKETRPGEGYTAVIYFHGMGSQRRFEETGRLIDSLDLYSNVSVDEGRPAGKLVDIKARPELSRIDPEKTVNHIRLFLTEKKGGRWTPYAKGETRFYEVYWAPVLAGQSSPWRIMRWMFSQVLRPWRTVGTPWRERQRLRRAALAGLFEPGATLPPGVIPSDFRKLVALYDKFEGLPAHRTHRAGSFRDFCKFVTAETRGPDAGRRLVALAKLWCRTYRLEEARNAFALTTIALAITLLSGALVLFVLSLLQGLAALQFDNALLREFADSLAPDFKTAAGITVTLLLWLGVGKFLTDYMGDVEAWSTYRETDEKHERRRRIIAEGVDTFRHVLTDEKCKRAVVIAHSLGTTIAHDTLLEVARHNRAAFPSDPLSQPVPLLKIEHFVTLGSPIDKVEYFFESYSSRSHRYKRAVEQLRGDIGQEPFSRNTKPYIHWINFWDEGDPVSGALHSPINRNRVDHRVDNVHVESFAFPAPGASHLAYLDNRTVIETLFEIIFKRARSFQALPRIEGQERDFASTYMGPGKRGRGRRVHLLTALALPWLALGGLAFSFLRGSWSVWPFAPAVVAALVLTSGYAFSLAAGPRDPLKARKGAAAKAEAGTKAVAEPPAARRVEPEQAMPEAAE